MVKNFVAPKSKKPKSNGKDCGKAPQSKKPKLNGKDCGKAPQSKAKVKPKSSLYSQSCMLESEPGLRPKRDMAGPCALKGFT